MLVLLDRVCLRLFLCVSWCVQIMDEADRMLNMDYEKELDKILAVIPRERRTFLFSATMTSKVGKLQRASLRDPVKVEVNSKYKTVDTLIQRYMFVPQKFKVRSRVASGIRTPCHVNNHSFVVGHVLNTTT